MTNKRHQRKLPRTPLLVRWTLCAVFAAIVTSAVIQYSFRHGRLITVPTYDDIGYFADGADRLACIYEAGFPALWQSYMMHPPHSPFESFMATSAFALFGLHEWAPYVMNGLLALAFFLAADWLLRGLGLWSRFLCFIFVASWPFVGMAVHEFRPDHAAALFTTIGLFMILSRPFVYGQRRRQSWAGIWLGIAMLAKPPIFPQTLALGLAAMVLATLSGWIATGRTPRLFALVRAWLSVIVPFLLISLPHFYHDRKHIVSYIHDILFGTFRQSYELRAAPTDHLLYFLTGPGGSVMLGDFLWILLGIVVAGGITIAMTGSRRDRARVATMLLVMLLAWLIPTVNKTKSSYFGLAFDTIFGFTALYIVSRVLLAEAIHHGGAETRRRFLPYHGRPARVFSEKQNKILKSPSVPPCLRGDSEFPIAAGALILTAIVSLWNFQWPVRNGNVSAGWEIQRRQIVQGIFQTIVSHCDFHHLDERPPADPAVPHSQIVHASHPQVLFCCMGDFNPDMMQFMAIQHQVPLRTLINSGSGKPEDFLYYFGRADFIFCSEPDTLLNVDFLPFVPIQQQLLDEARSRSEFEQIGKWTFMKSAHSMYIFRRKDFSGFTPAIGLSEEIGPVAGYDESTVRWGLGPSTKLKIAADHDGAYEVYWRSLTDFPNQIVTVKRDGQVIGTQPVTTSEREFGEARFPVALTAGDHELEFDYAHWHIDNPIPQAVVFQHLNVARKPTTAQSN